MVTPTPQQALLMPGAPCSPFQAPIDACTLGAPADRARATVALVGDSHADHWAAAFGGMAKALDWQGIKFMESSCPLSRAVPKAPKAKQDQCVQWNEDLAQYLASRPEITTIFTSNHPGRVIVAPGQSQRAARIHGIVSAWNALPPSVAHIVVIRDDPFIKRSTLPCVQHAIATHRDAGTACAFPRNATTLRPDYYVQAAKKLHSPRIQVVDLTHFFCGSRRCYPVIGGVLVYKDFFDHMTRTYVTTLEPYLLARVKRLMSSWR